MEESYVSLAELKVILEKEKAVRGEVNPEQQYSLSHAALFARVAAEKVPAIVKELMEIPMMSPFNAVKIVDLMPTHLDDVRAIFAKERFSLSKEDADKSSRLWGSTADEATRMEDYARILDFLPQGHPDQSKFHREPLTYALGVDEFKLFELVPKESVTLSVGQRVYIGKDVEMRKEVLHVKRRVGYEELTTAAQKELPFVIQETVKEKEAKFVDFFNRAQAITTRFHMLELLPGLGKKTMWAILEERKKGPFKSFQDLDQRVPSIHHPEKLVAKRIEMEISDPTQKYRLFVAR